MFYGAVLSDHVPSLKTGVISIYICSLVFYTIDPRLE